jgi:DNA-binding response OmpR family regulator
MDQTADLTGMKILVVDDNFLIADMLCEALRGYGCEIIGPAPSVELGKTLVEESCAGTETLSGALLDVNLDGASSVPIASKLRELGIPFVFLTGYGDQAVLPAEFRSAPRIAKPCDLDEVARSLRAAILSAGTH